MGNIHVDIYNILYLSVSSADHPTCRYHLSDRVFKKGKNKSNIKN